GFAAGIPAFNDRNLISSALHSGSATATIAGPSPFGQLRLYAQRVSDPRGGILGVVEAGQPVGDRLAALNTLALLLLILGPLALIIAAAGGLILANRALAPARMSYLRQRNFIADASHELRTPLTMLRADAEVLLRRRAMLESEDAALLDDMVAETSHMTSLANSMLRLARLDSTDEPLEQDVCDLAGLAATIVHRIAPLAEEHGIAVHLATGGPQSLIIGDQQLLEQAVLVLVDNAVKYNHPGGEVMIRTENHGELVILTVHDTGIGMTPEDLAHLGERFYRVDKARSREGGGAGLGVSIARSIILRHRGSLEFQSEAGKSTSARVSLPAAAAPSNGGKA
ncbi:MAG: sensor histidine kinase, partial [Chloroflexota bacterium]